MMHPRCPAKRSSARLNDRGSPTLRSFVPGSLTRLLARPPTRCPATPATDLESWYRPEEVDPRIVLAHAAARIHHGPLCAEAELGREHRGGVDLLEHCGLEIV